MLFQELDTWFIIYGVIKITPHFIFLSYIAAELCVRFVYDSIYLSLKHKQHVHPVPDKPMDNSDQNHVTKLLRSNSHRAQAITQQNKANQSRFRKILNSIYVWDDDFRFTTMIICIYTVAIVFLYYLTCTFIFLYLSRTTGHIAFLKSYIESSADIGM